MTEINTSEKYDEGLGTVYERFMLNNYFDRLMKSYRVKSVLETPIFGMTGLTGINSVHFNMKGIKTILADTKNESIIEARKHIETLSLKDNCEIEMLRDSSKLPFDKNSFDLVWNFAAIWHVKDAGLLLNEMFRVSSGLILVFIPNNRQIGYALRKYIFDKGFFETVDESWTDINNVAEQLTSCGARVVEKGFIDIPFWPDTAVPVKRLLKGVLNNREAAEEKRKPFDKKWNWDIMNYYMGSNPDLKDTIERLSFLEKLPLPVMFKAFWAHHKYILCLK